MTTPLTESGTPSGSYSFSERISILFIVQASSLSAISIIVLLAYKFYRTISQIGRTHSDACDSSLFITLMVGEALRAVGKITSVRWMVEGKITAPTTFCTAQGMIQLIGTNLIDWSTLAITIQTFVILVVQWNAPTHFAKYLTLGVWSVVGLIIGTTIGVKGLEIIGPAGSWCWLLPSHRVEQLLAEYLWMWIIVILTIIFYGIDALVIRGYVTIEKPSHKLRWVSRNRVHLELINANSEEERQSKEMAARLLFYPLIYFICVFPFTITRWMSFSGHVIPNEAAAFTTCIFSLSGFLNVILFFKTRPQLFTGADDDTEKHSTYPLPPDDPEDNYHKHGQLPLDNLREENLVLAHPYHSRNDSKYRAEEAKDGLHLQPELTYDRSRNASSSKERRRGVTESPTRYTDDDESDQGHLPHM